jgi:hypothetical protein
LLKVPVIRQGIAPAIPWPLIPGGAARNALCTCNHAAELPHGNFRTYTQYRDFAEGKIAPLVRAPGIVVEILFAAGKKIETDSPVSGAKRRKGAQILSYQNKKIYAKNPICFLAIAGIYRCAL